MPVRCRPDASKSYSGGNIYAYIFLFCPQRPCCLSEKNVPILSICINTVTELISQYVIATLDTAVSIFKYMNVPPL